MYDAAPIARYSESARRGARWLLEQQDGDGSFVIAGEPQETSYNGYYKIPYALAVAGYPRQAHTLLDWVTRSGALTSEGDLHHKVWHEECYSYPNSWMIIGAQRLGRFDFSRPALEFLRRLISPTTGGVYAEWPAAEAGGGRQDMVSSSQAGSACLYMGLWAEATRIGDWFVEMLRRQPDLEHSLYACCDWAGNLLMEYPADKAAMYVVDSSKPMQWYFYPGIAMGFLAKLYLATRRSEYLRAAAAYFDFFSRCVDEKYRNGTSGKVAWGSAQMYALTGEERYRHAAVAIGDWMLEVQSSDGHWDPGPPNPITHYLKLDATAEFVAWQSEIAQHLARA